MSSSGFENRILSVCSYGILLHQQRSNRFESHFKINVLSVADTTLDAAAIIGSRINSAIVIIEQVVLHLSRFANSFEASSVLKSFYGINAEHCLSKSSVQLAEYRLS